MGNWADTPKDILESIFKRLGNDLIHNLNFGCVCRNWRALAGEKEIDIRPRVMLVDIDRIRPIHAPDIGTLLTLSSNAYNIHQNIHAKLFTQRCFGFLDGFLITVDINTGSVQLLNPILGTDIRLPTPSVLGLEQHETGPIDSVFISSLIANSGCVIVFRHASQNLHLCRLGNEDWTTLKLPFGGVRDVTCHKDKLYVINTNSNIDVFDLQMKNLLSYMIKLHKPAYPLPKRRKLQGKYYTDVKQLNVPRDFDGVGKISTVYLVNTPEGVLLMVVRYGSRCHTMGFKIFRQVKGDHDWHPVISLGEKVLFIGQHSLCLTADTALKCQKDSIYFIRSRSWLDSGIFSMHSGRIQPIYKECTLSVYPKTWFIPNIRPNFQSPI